MTQSVAPESDLFHQARQWLARHPLWLATGLSLGTIIGTSLVRFSYALFVPVMRNDLGWSYLVLGAMNTAHAAGYLLGALTLSMVINRWSSWLSFVMGGVLSSLFLGLCGTDTQAWSIGLLRFLSGFTSASVFAGGTVLIAQLAAAHPARSGLLLGIYYAGGGFGMVLCAVLVPGSIAWGEHGQWPHPWQAGWLAVGAMGLLMSALMWLPARAVPAAAPRSAASGLGNVRRCAHMLGAYFCFGMGYIGYMTFVISLLRELHWHTTQTSGFFALMGVCGMFSVQAWSGILDKYKAGQCLAIVNSLLAVSCVIPAWVAFSAEAGEVARFETVAVFLSGAVFGGSFATAVASTTAFIKHNLPASEWVTVITVFTSVFAVGQVFGPSLTGWISDHAGGLPVGLVFSAAILALGAWLATRQTALHLTTQSR